MDLEDKRQLKNFYRNNMRMAIAALFFLSLLMIVLLIMIFYYVVVKSPPEYYATNSAGFITPLQGMRGPNESTQYLLPPDPPEEPEKVLNLE